MKKFKFSRKFHTIPSIHFSSILKNPPFRFETDHISVFSRSNSSTIPRMGVLISKKTIKKSHERNRFKRIIRESFRLQQFILPNMDFIIILKKVANLKSTEDNFSLKEELKEIWFHHRI